MSDTTGRRNFLRGMAATVAGALVAPVVSAEAAPAEKPEWACDWPPTARAGVLIACEDEPGYYTKGGTPILFESHTALFPDVSRHIVPPDGLLVYEIAVFGDTRFAVVRMPT